MPDGMRVCQIPISPMSVANRERWQGLADRAVEPNPFFEPAFAQLAAERLGERGTSLLVVEDAGGWNACLPVQSAKVARVDPGLRTWMHLYCFLGTPCSRRARALRRRLGCYSRPVPSRGGCWCSRASARAARPRSR